VFGNVSVLRCKPFLRKLVKSCVVCGFVWRKKQCSRTASAPREQISARGLFLRAVVIKSAVVCCNATPRVLLRRNAAVPCARLAL
jgi:hypothetical protein